MGGPLIVERGGSKKVNGQTSEEKKKGLTLFGGCVKKGKDRIRWGGRGKQGVLVGHPEKEGKLKKGIRGGHKDDPRNRIPART